MLSLWIIEDSLEDFVALKRALKASDASLSITHFETGDLALAQLKDTQPSVILLDLNLPGTDGRDILYNLKQDDTYKHIPVIVLSTSDNPKDVHDCYTYGANAYMLKPVDFVSFKQTMIDFARYWSHVFLCDDCAGH